MRPARLLAALAVLGLAVGVARPSGAADLPPAAAALVPLQAEMMLLVELDALEGPLTPKVREVHDQWVSYTAGMDRDALVAWLVDADRDGADALTRLVAEVGSPSQQVRMALGPITAGDLDAVRAGGRISIGAAAYGKAWFDLDERDGREPGAVSPVPSPTVAETIAVDPPTVPATVGSTVASRPAPVVTQPQAATLPPSTTPPATPPSTTPAATDPTTITTASAPVSAAAPATTATVLDADPTSSTTGGTTTIIAVVLGLVAFVVAVFAVLFRRRPADPGALSQRAVADILDAGQRLAGSLDRDEVERRAVEEAVGMTLAQHGAFVRGRAAVRAVTHTTTDGFPTDADLTRGVVARALDAGQTGRTSGSDRAVSGDRLALLAVPTVHAGTVVGALVVARPAERPFTTADAEALGRLAPLVAGALDAADRHADTAELALVDPLTSVGNRRRLQRDLPGALAGGPVGLAMVDVDHFKQFNDTFGHQDGDEALRLVAAALRANVRETDVVYRYGGEEFCVLLPGATPDEALDTAERLRLAVAAATALSWSSDPRRALTVSVGLAVSSDGTGDDLVERADHALYAAKRAGRDRVVVAG